MPLLLHLGQSVGHGGKARAAPRCWCGGNVPAALFAHGFSSPLALFNLTFGKTTQFPSPLCVSICSYLNLLQRLLKAVGGPGKRPGSACALAPWKRCCSSSTERRRTPSRAARRLATSAKDHTWGSRAEEQHASLHPSPAAVWLSSSQCHHQWGEAGPQSWGA